MSSSPSSVSLSIYSYGSGCRGVLGFLRDFSDRTSDVISLVSRSSRVSSSSSSSAEFPPSLATELDRLLRANLRLQRFLERFLHRDQLYQSFDEDAEGAAALDWAMEAEFQKKFQLEEEKKAESAFEQGKWRELNNENSIAKAKVEALLTQSNTNTAAAAQQSRSPPVSRIPLLHGKLLPSPDPSVDPTASVSASSPDPASLSPRSLMSAASHPSTAELFATRILAQVDALMEARSQNFANVDRKSLKASASTAAVNAKPAKQSKSMVRSSSTQAIETKKELKQTRMTKVDTANESKRLSVTAGQRTSNFELDEEISFHTPLPASKAGKQKRAPKSAFESDNLPDSDAVDRLFDEVVQSRQNSEKVEKRSSNLNHTAPRTSNNVAPASGQIRRPAAAALELTDPLPRTRAAAPRSAATRPRRESLVATAAAASRSPPSQSPSLPVRSLISSSGRSDSSSSARLLPNDAALRARERIRSKRKEMWEPVASLTGLPEPTAVLKTLKQIEKQREKELLQQITGKSY